MPCGEPVEPAVVLKVAVVLSELAEEKVTFPVPETLDHVTDKLEP